MCTLTNPCGGVLAEDVQITHDLREADIFDRTVYRCLNAHHLVVGHVPLVDQNVCSWCGAHFIPTKGCKERQVFCSKVCRNRQWELDHEKVHAPHVKPEIVSAIVAQLRADPEANRTALADEFGVHERTVRRVAEKAGIQSPGRVQSQARWHPE